MTRGARRPPVDHPSVIVVMADGARPDLIDTAVRAGKMPALARLISEGGFHTITSTFPSVTGPAYAPFLMGRYPGPVGLPGLRWYDRSRHAVRSPGHARSYVGHQMRHVDRDVDPATPTVFELVSSSIASRSVIGRGLHPEDRIGRGMRFIARTAMTHFGGKVREWLEIDRDIAEATIDRVRSRNPEFAFVVLLGIDKMSHSVGQGSLLAERALEIVDHTVAELRADAERAGRWERTHLWVASDHGHSAVDKHDDIAELMRAVGFRVIAHPWVHRPDGEVAVMVSGNAMAHVYVDLSKRTRQWWPSLSNRWTAIKRALAATDSVDLAIIPQALGACEVHGSGRGHAHLEWTGGRISYRPVSGDPLGLGVCEQLDNDSAYDITRDTDYPDALVQISALSDSPRSGEIILSAARGWDFRARYEPIPHVSSHGALHRDHMLVPLIVNRPTTAPPRRTVDVMPSALRALGITVPDRLDGRSFL